VIAECCCPEARDIVVTKAKS